MIRSLVAREYGGEAHDLDDILHDNWSRLQPNIHDSIQAPFRLNHFLTLLDVHTTTTTSLLLTGGTSQTQPTLSIYQLPLPFTKPAQQPVVTSVPQCFGSHVENCTVTNIKWFPCDASLFMTGITDHVNGPSVCVWDTEEFCIAATIPLHSTDLAKEAHPVYTISTCDHHSAKSELIAVTTGKRSFITLLDLSSGSTTHTLHPEFATSHVHDVVWSPTNPHLLASASEDGSVSLFDVRRSGTVACLMSMDNRSPKFPNPSDIPPGAPSQNQSDANQLPLVPLGLSCAWKGMSNLRHDELHRRRRRHRLGSRRRSASHLQTPNDGKKKTCIRFTPDGSTIVSRKKAKGFLAHDVLTGRLLSKFPIHEGGADTFEVSPDCLHVICFSECCLSYIDLMDGRFVHRSSPGPNVFDFVMNQFDQQLISVGGHSIDFWDCPKQPDGQNDEGDEEDRYGDGGERDDDRERLFS